MSVHEKQTDLWARIRFLHTNYPELLSESEVNKSPYVFWMAAI
jgi:hypothetical protein